MTGDKTLASELLQRHFQTLVNDNMWKRARVVDRAVSVLSSMLDKPPDKKWLKVTDI